MNIHIISMNIWGDPQMADERAKIVISCVIDALPDIIFLQEVTNRTVLSLTQALRAKGYQYKLSNKHNRQKYELVACKYPINKSKFRRFSTSSVHNGVLWVAVDYNNAPLVLATSQLEDGSNNVVKRAGQLDCALEYLQHKFDNAPVIFGCDTNMMKESYTMPEYWQDAWKANGNNKYLQYTYNSNTNNNIVVSAAAADSAAAAALHRPDRIYMYNISTVPYFPFALIGKPVETPLGHRGNGDNDKHGNGGDDAEKRSSNPDKHVNGDDDGNTRGNKQQGGRKDGGGDANKELLPSTRYGLSIKVEL